MWPHDHKVEIPFHRVLVRQKFDLWQKYNPTLKLNETDPVVSCPAVVDTDLAKKTFVFEKHIAADFHKNLPGMDSLHVSLSLLAPTSPLPLDDTNLSSQHQ